MNFRLFEPRIQADAEFGAYGVYIFIERSSYRSESRDLSAGPSGGETGFSVHTNDPKSATFTLIGLIAEGKITVEAALAKLVDLFPGEPVFVRLIEVLKATREE